MDLAGVLEFLRTHDVPARQVDVDTIVVTAPSWWVDSEAQVAVVTEELCEATNDPEAYVEITPGPSLTEATLTFSRKVVVQ